MSKTLSAVAQQQFDDDVKHAFQGGSILKNTVTIRNNVKADIYKFRRLGKGLANQKATQADVTPMDVSHSLINCTLENWNAPEYTDIFDQAEVNFDEQKELAEAIAMALGRRCDQLILDAMTAETPSTIIAHGGTGLTLAKIIAVNKGFKQLGVPAGDRYICVEATALEDVLGDSTITNIDYNSVKALMTGDLKSFMGLEWRFMEDRTEGGIDLTASTYTGFAWHKSAVGMAIGIDIKTEVNYIAQKTSWLCNGLLKAGAVSRDADGIVEIGYQ